ncbi:hypothetical protein NQZ68_002472 [Dissostichus eleginoides]|nr:hypothetical protein NQZ68_002472 [Dissostichus eleginoides]
MFRYWNGGLDDGHLWKVVLEVKRIEAPLTASGHWTLKVAETACLAAPANIERGLMSFEAGLIYVASHDMPAGSDTHLGARGVFSVCGSRNRWSWLDGV